MRKPKGFVCKQLPSRNRNYALFVNRPESCIAKLANSRRRDDLDDKTLDGCSQLRIDCFESSVLHDFFSDDSCEDFNWTGDYLDYIILVVRRLIE